MPPATLPGLTYLPNYIDASTEAALIHILDAQPWISDLKRRVQHYGYRYHYKTGYSTDTVLGPLPDWLMPYCQRLHKSGAFSELPDQVIINEYEPGQGIAPHIDRTRFDRTVASLSLGSPCVMDFIHADTGEKISRLLEPRSLLLISDEARYQWMHGIAPRKTDRYHGQIIMRGRRISLTFRKMIGEN